MCIICCAPMADPLDFLGPVPNSGMEGAPSKGYLFLLFEVLSSIIIRRRIGTVTESQNCWVGRDPLGSSKSNSWPYTGHPKTYTMSLRVLSKCCFISVRLGALVSLGRQYSRWGCSRAEQSRTITYLDWLLMLCLKISLSLTSLRDERFLVPLICWLCWSKWAFFSRKIMPWKMFVSHFTVLFMLHFTIRQ